MPVVSIADGLNRLPAVGGLAISSRKAIAVHQRAAKNCQKTQIHGTRACQLFF